MECSCALVCLEGWSCGGGKLRGGMTGERAWSVHYSTAENLSACRSARRRALGSVGGAALAVLWAAHTAARLLTWRSPLLEGQHSVVLFPCILLYTSFALLSLY